MDSTTCRAQPGLVSSVDWNGYQYYTSTARGMRRYEQG
ncbi:MAG: hypothetical protein OJF49_002031 [Ktedonobacterales bacterium]|nr:MAG: hypothetical protein OJF49_002031 [Ktedonobacterales bacterium]